MARTASKRRSRPRGWGSRIVGWIVRAAVLFVLISILWTLLYRFVPPPVTATMIGDMLGGRGVAKDWTSLPNIDRDMVRAAIAAEDGKFCSHNGFDADAIAQAMRENAEGGRIRGGSTISQQTAKNAFLWQSGGWFRKGLEAWFTVLIEQLWSKRRIMEVYLNIAETGLGTYGVEAGAQRYFGKGAASLSRNEAARIAAVLPLPKQREAVSPTGFTRRYGNSIAARVRVVARDGLDGCVYYGGAPAPAAEPEQAPARRETRQAPPPPEPENIEDYIDAPDIGEPVVIDAPPAPVTEPEAIPTIEVPPPVEEPTPEPELNGFQPVRTAA